MKTILVTGGAGFIGSWITSQLINLGHEVVIIDNTQNNAGLNEEHFQKIIKFRQKYLLEGAKIYAEDYQKRGDKILAKMGTEKRYFTIYD